MPRTGENIYKRKDGRWEGRYIKERVGGKARENIWQSFGTNWLFPMDFREFF